jgi:pimeloyl-ACP methyl ester carboxylesterase/DNA-binding response OmpR family regulator
MDSSLTETRTPLAAPTADLPAKSSSLRHELRTPVNHIIGYSEMLLEEAAEIEGRERFAALDEVVAAGRAMLAAINGWLDGVEGEVQAEQLATLHAQLAPLLGRTTRTAQELAARAEAEGPASFAADLLKVAAAAAHLGDLAAGAALLQQTPAPPEPVLDREASATIEALGGRLLVVDDNPLNREMLARRLERLGYTTRHAENGRQALEVLHEEPFDLVLLDMMMPELDGYGVLQAMQADPELSRVPVIVLSALDELEHVVRAMELGADDYLPKPFDPVLLNARISACLHKKRMRDLEVDYLEQIEEEKRRADRLLNVVIPLGVALSVEKDFNQLLEKIVVQAQDLCNADGGTLYLRTDDQKLRFVIVRNRSLDIAMGGVAGKDIPFPPLRLYDEQSERPLYNYVVTHAALDGKTINIADAYDAEGYDFSGTREFDTRTGYRTTSVLNVPLKDGLGRVIGVLQLINAQRDGQVVAFDGASAQMLESLGALAAAALSAYAREQQLRQEISDLKIEIDQQKKQREVDEIAGSAYFLGLQERAKSLRAGGDGKEADGPKGPERKVYVVDGQEIVVREQGRGRLLLLIHGWSSSWYALSPLIPHLSERYRCVAVDLPGYGESPPLPEPATIPAYADLLAGLIKQLSPGMPAVLVGHSMGGMTSVTLGLRHPDLVERMVLLCPTISGKLSYWINWFISPITMIERSRVAGKVVAHLEPYMMNVTDLLMRPASFAERTGISEQDYQRLRADARRPGQGRVRADCFWAMKANDLQGKLGGLTIPTQVIWGMEDNTVPLRDASVVADELPGAELIVLPKAGHWPHFETPEVTRRHIRSFLSKPIKLLKANL